MNVRTMLRTAAAAVAIGVMVLGSPAGLALAAPKETPAQSCKRRGYVWSDDFGCADKSCEYNGKTYGPGAVTNVKVLTANGYRNGTAYCDGFTGKVKLLGRVDPNPGRADPVGSSHTLEQAP